MNLQLSLKRNWFEMTKAGVKQEDYREITPFWCNRLLRTLNGGYRSKIWWHQNFFENRSIEKTMVSLKGNSSFVPFIRNVMTDGYPKMKDLDRILNIEHKGIEIREGNPDWGAEVGKLYFVIKHGAIL